jgi:hypothetical protein
MCFLKRKPKTKFEIPEQPDLRWMYFIIYTCLFIVNLLPVIAKLSGPCYPLGIIGTVPRAYEGMEGRKIKIN